MYYVILNENKQLKFKAKYYDRGSKTFTCNLFDVIIKRFVYLYPSVSFEVPIMQLLFTR